MSLWVYILGEKTGEDMKIGHSKQPTMRSRLKTVNGEQTTSASYVLLAAAHATRKDETAMKASFAHLRREDKGDRTEYFSPGEDLIGYANWLRAQYWVSVDQDDPLVDVEMIDPEHWLPADGREIAPPPRDDLKIVQDYEDPSDHLYNTAWSWMAGQKAGVQDYFTPSEIVEAAREAMGGIDLDVASHPQANRVHRIPDFFHTGRSAFHNDWYGRVWLNPPYGNNEPWFERIVHFVDGGMVSQLCMLSPMWAFQTKLAEPVMRRTSGLLLLTPTPKFWGNSDPNKVGKNHPHGIIYIGDSPERFHSAFASFGMPLRAAWLDEVIA